MYGRVVEESVAILGNILPKMFVGIVAGSFLISAPFFKTLAEVSARFLRMRSGIAVISFFANKALSLSILSQMHKKGVIDEREVLVAHIAGLFPMALRSSVLTLAPVAISTLGFKLGLTYLAIELFSKLVVASIAVWFGRRSVSNDPYFFDFDYPLSESLILALKTFVRVSVIITPTVFATLFLINLNEAAVNEEFVIVLAGAGSTLAGFGVAGSLLAKGEVNRGEVLLLLFVALALHRLVESARFSTPLNVSFFGRKLGIRLSIFTLLANEASCALSIALLLTLLSFNLL